MRAERRTGTRSATSSVVADLRAVRIVYEGRNTLAVHNWNRNGGQYIDVSVACVEESRQEK